MTAARRAPAIAALALMLACGLAIGLWSSWLALSSGAGPGSIAYGPWLTWHKAGGADADPYSLAVVARRGDLPMAPAEGVAFFASRDQQGANLVTRCRYELAGAFPAARAWTLTAYRADGRLLQGPSGRSGFTSAEALVDVPPSEQGRAGSRPADGNPTTAGAAAAGRVAIALSAEPTAGNWLPLGGDERFILALRLYETPLSASVATLDAGGLPTIRRLGCR